MLKSQGIIPGIKVDTGLQPLPFSQGETATQGLDGMGDRMKKYYAQGARFAKWRAVIKLDASEFPSDKAIWENCHGLARYAQIAQENGLVPIIEPEVTLGEGDYTIERNAYISEKVNSQVMRWLNEYNVCLEASLLKPNMNIGGLDGPVSSPKEVAKYTVQVMKRTIPAAIPGIHFLSGGMSAEESTLNVSLRAAFLTCVSPMFPLTWMHFVRRSCLQLQALQEEYPDAPWSLTFSYGRALQSDTMKTWAGKPENVDAAKEMLLKLAKANSEAQLGIYKGPHPAPGGGRILQQLRLGGAGK